jgi:ubiquinone/menaquinone biosynthesis C-methylase UbiE
MKLNTILKFYNGEKYDQSMSAVYSELIDRAYLFKLLQLKPGQSVLEICSGTGLNFPYYRKDLEKITALDIHPSMLRIAKRRSKGLPVEIKRADCSKLEFGDNTFDIVLETLGLCVAPKPDKIFAEMARVTKIGGSVAVFDMCLSPDPKTALAQELMKPACSESGYPEKNIVWDPTVEIEKLANGLSLRLIHKKMIEKNTPWARGYFVWRKIE